MPGSFDPLIILLSFLIATLAGFVAFESIAYTRLSLRPGLWAFISGATLGMGIWSMHFIGMQAWKPPFPLYYAVTPTVISVLVAMASSWLAMRLAVREKSTGTQRGVLLGALLVGSGIAAMHYIGMEAMHFTEPVMWSKPGVALSIVIAIFASLAAMIMLQNSFEESFNMRRQVLASVVIGVAICGMHYTGMLAMMVPSDSVSVALPGAVGGLVLARIGVGVSLVVMLAVLVIIAQRKSQLAAAAHAQTLQEPSDN